LSEDQARPQVAARLYPANGRASAVAATLQAGDQRGVLRMYVADEAAPRVLQVALLHVSERFNRAVRVVQLADGSVLEIDDGAQLSRVLAAAGKPDAMVTRWQHSWRMVVVSLCLSIAAAVAGYVWGLPVLADVMASKVPTAWTAALDRVVIAQLKQIDSLQDSELPQADQQRLRARFDAVIASLPASDAPPKVSVQFFKMGNMPNAFALPGGSIVFFDGLVKTAPNDDALVGVFAHEFGHVQHRHGLRNLLRTAALSGIAAWYFGDLTVLASAAVVVSQLSYSRDFETQADDVALKLMRTNHLDTKALAELFRRMRDKGAAHDHEGDTTKPATKPSTEPAAKPTKAFSFPEFLNTHPDIDRRIERFEKAAQ
jgi:Zn-dependent protease with chaperone function